MRVWTITLTGCLLLCASTSAAWAQAMRVIPGYGNPAIGAYWSNSGYDPRYSYTLPTVSYYAPGTVWGGAVGPWGGYRYGATYGPAVPHYGGYGPAYGPGYGSYGMYSLPGTYGGMTYGQWGW